MSPAFAQVLSYAVVPVAGFALAAASAVLVHGASYLREKTHNELLARVTDSAASLAAEAALVLTNLPPGTSAQVAESDVVRAAVEKLTTSMGPTIKRLGTNNMPDATTLVRGELGKLLIGSPGTPQPLAALQNAAAGESAPVAAPATR